MNSRYVVKDYTDIVISRKSDDTPLLIIEQIHNDNLILYPDSHTLCIKLDVDEDTGKEIMETLKG